MSVLSVGDKRYLRDWVTRTYPEMTSLSTYRGFFVFSKKTGLVGDQPRIFVRNDRGIVSYNPKTDRSYSQKGPERAGWRQRLQTSLGRKIEKLWGIQNDQ